MEKKSKENKESELSFEEHFSLLREFQSDLERDNVSIDELVVRMEQAAKSISICKSKLAKAADGIKLIEKELTSE